MSKSGFTDSLLCLNTFTVKFFIHFWDIRVWTDGQTTCSDLHFNISQNECLSVIRPNVTDRFCKICPEFVEFALHSESKEKILMHSARCSWHLGKTSFLPRNKVAVSSTKILLIRLPDHTATYSSTGYLSTDSRRSTRPYPNNSGQSRVDTRNCPSVRCYQTASFCLLSRYGRNSEVRPITGHEGPEGQ